MSGKKTKKIDRVWDWVLTWIYSLLCSIKQTPEFDLILLVAYAYSHFRTVVGRVSKEFIIIFALSFSVLKDMILGGDGVLFPEFFPINFHEETTTFPNFLVYWEVSKQHWRSNQHFSSFWPDLFLSFTDFFVLWLVSYHNWVIILHAIPYERMTKFLLQNKKQSRRLQNSRCFSQKTWAWDHMLIRWALSHQSPHFLQTAASEHFYWSADRLALAVVAC